MKIKIASLFFILLLVGCSPKIDYSFFQENGQLVYVMEHKDETKAEFEAKNKRALLGASEKDYESLYYFLTPFLQIDSDSDSLSNAHFQYGTRLHSIVGETSYEIDETGQKLIIKKVKGSGQDATLNTFVFTFRIIDCETLQFLADESSDFEQILDNGFISVSDGAIFRLQKQ